MNEQEMYVRVGQLATRVGYPMPAIERTTDPKVPAVRLKQGAVGPTMVLRCHTEELPGQVFDFLVTQDLVQARKGVLRRHWWGAYVIPLGLGLAVGTVTDWPAWLGFALVILVCTPVIGAVESVRRRAYLRTTDRLVVDVLGADEVSSALTWLAECQAWPKNLRWLWYGALPSPADRLRKLGVRTA
ncbi:hypothetical protein [Kribbella sp. DT2]|uniref:hypothetical protein n=1 Tax=Kribbella sp. DT2 TaxID=3393427 RepID=UPI003CF584AE